MLSAYLDNVSGHRNKAAYPAEDVGKLFVGGGSDPVLTGYIEAEGMRNVRRSRRRRGRPMPANYPASRQNVTRIVLSSV
jgi:hypothetical protein